MTSERMVATNRANAQNSRGPRTAAGKMRVSRNAVRYGLAAMTYRQSAAVDEVERMAKAICDGDNNPLLFEQAIIIAENELVLRSVSAECVAVIERLRDPAAIALAKGSNALALMKARSELMEKAYDELKRHDATILVENGVDAEKYELLIAKLKQEPYPGCKPTDPALAAFLNGIKDRDENDAVREAIPDLRRLQRYERRTWSRLKRAISTFIAIRVMGNLKT
jgi:hypothetical protein